MIEDTKTEFKREFTETFLKTVVAFSNGSGGTIFIGIDDSGNIYDIADYDMTARKCVQMIADKIRPDVALTTDVDVIEKEGKHIIKIEVREGIKKPYYLKEKGLCAEGVYVRKGPSSVPITNDGLYQMIQELRAVSFETQISFEQSVTFTFLEKILMENNIKLTKEKKEMIDIENKGRVTQLGYILSDQYDECIKIAAFSDDSRALFADREILQGSIIKQMHDAMEFLNKHNRVRSAFNGLKRVDTYAFPPDALRECLINAVVHRDYSSQATTLISVYPDRVEFVSPGGLNTPFTLGELETGVSSLRNKNLATLLYRIGYVEAFGTGIPRIMNSYRCSRRKPVIEFSSSIFKIILPTTETEDYDEVEDFLNNHEEFSRLDLQDALGLSKSGAVALISELLEKDKIAKSGNGPSTRYTIR